MAANPAPPDLPDALALATAWPFLGQPGDLTFSSLRGGTNNNLYRVTSAASSVGAYVLRLSAPHLDERRARLEYATLAALERRGLPFAVPAPLLTAEGAPWLEAPSPRGRTLATLTRFIPGAAPNRENQAQAESAGEALGALDSALATVELASDDAALTWRSTGALDQITPLVPDPPAAFARLPIAATERSRLVDGYTAVVARLPALYAALPQQLCHEDAGPGNLLIEGDRVTGILDFEFLARDLRVMDVTVALAWWPVDVLESGAEWSIIAAVARGYTRALRLTRAEIAAIPTLWAMRGYTSLIHRLGRALQGVSPMTHVIDRAEAALAWEDWLRAHSERLAETLAEAVQAP